MVDTIRTAKDFLKNLFQAGQANLSIGSSRLRDLVVTLFAKSFTSAPSDPTAIFSRNPGDCWLNSTTGQLWQFNGTKWTKLAVLTVQAPTLVSPAYYVSTTGSDSNAGTISAPFLTLGHAQTAMQSGNKTTYIRGGTYTIGTGLTLTSSDSSTSWLAYPGDTPILDGSTTTGTCFTINAGAGSITINGMTIQRFANVGIDLMGSGMVITNNTINNITSSNTGQGCIYMHFILGTTNVSHNLCSNNTGPGISMAFGAGDPGASGTITVDSNIVLNTNTNLSDTGGIYLMDRSHTMTSCICTNNIIGNYGKSPYSSTQGVGIYLDDNMSHATVTGNIIYGNGMYALQYHGGDHNIVTNNIIDLTNAFKLVLYQDQPTFVIGGGGMASNTFTNNIVYSSASPPTPLWDYIDTSVTIALPTVTHNQYFNSVSPFPNTGTIVDSSPLVGDPLFSNAASNIYTLRPDSPAFDSPVSFVPGGATQGPN